MASMSFLCVFVIFSSILQLGFSDPGSTLLSQGLQYDVTMAAARSKMQCLQKLIPCQPFLQSPTNPPATCCTPLKELLANNTDCLCSFFDDQEILKSVHVTQEEALKLPAACAVDVDIKKCNAEASSPTHAAPAPLTAVTVTLPNISANAVNATEDSTSSTSMITPYGTTHFGVPGLVALLIALVLS